MSNKKKKRPSGTASTYRAPAQVTAPPRRGLLDGLLAPRTPGASPMPKFRSTLGRGAVTALSQPWLVVAIPVMMLLVWVLLTTLGFQGPFTVMGVTFAIPPITTFTDAQVTVDAILASIERAVRVPANIHVTREACVLDPRVRLHPVQALSLLAPKLFGFVQRLLVHSLVGRLVHQGGPVESVGDRIAICLRHHDSLPLLVNAML